MKTKIALLDDHSIVLDGIEAMLKGEPDFEVCGKFNTPDQLYEYLKTNTVQLILLDIFLPKPIGLEVLATLTKSYPKIFVLILSGNSEEDLISSAFKSGASAYLHKNSEKKELLSALSLVLQGEHYISAEIEKKLSSNFIHKARTGDKFAHFKLGILTPREIETVILLCEGLGYKEIALKLNISARTVEAHKNHILEKLELKNTIELVKFSVKNRLIEL